MFTNNLIGNINYLSSTTDFTNKSTAIKYVPFELKLQLHYRVNNPYNFNIDNNYRSYSSIKQEIVDLSYYAQNNIINYQTTTEIPEENLTYLQSGLKANNMSYMFYNCNNIKTIPKLNIDTSNVTNMYAMFSDCFYLTSLDLSNINTSNVTNMYAMFNNCISLTSLDLSNFNTSNVTDMNFMFSNCNTLTSLDLSNFNTFNVTSMNSIFRNCISLTNLDLSNFNTSNVTDMSNMFNNCNSLTNVIGSLDLNSCTNIRYMFNNCNSNVHIHLKNVPSSLNLSNSRGTEGQHYIIDNYID